MHWGNNIWTSLHIFAHAYDPRSQEPAMRAYLESTNKLLPCSSCRAHFRKGVTQIIDNGSLQSKQALKRDLIHIHNEINTQNGKKTWTLQQAEEHYSQFFPQECPLGEGEDEDDDIRQSESTLLVPAILGVIILLVIAFLLARRRR